MSVSHRTVTTAGLYYLLIVVPVFIYVLIRAIRVDITFDEAWTIMDFVPLDYSDIFCFNPPGTNNHILNTFAIKFLYTLLPETVFVARIPNVLAHAIFLVYGYLLCRRYFEEWLGLMVFLALVLNPFALDFFGLARGYGLFFAFEMGALYHILRYFEGRRLRDLLSVSVLGVLMVLSNMSTLYFYLGWLGVFAIDALRLRERLISRATIVFLCSVLIMVIVYGPIRKLIEVRGFYQGGRVGFFHDTMWSLLRYWMGSMEKSAENHLASAAVCLVILACVLTGLFAKDKNKIPLLVVTGIFGFAAVATVIQHHFFGGLYLTDRIALFFYPLMVLMLFFAIRSFEGKVLSAFLPVVICFLLVLNFVSVANLYKVTLNYFESHATEIFSYINKEGENKRKLQVVDYSWPFERSIAYHVSTGRYPYLVNGRKDFYGVNDSCDYYLYMGGRLDAVTYFPDKQPIALHPGKKDTILAFPTDKVYLLKIKEASVSSSFSP